MSEKKEAESNDNEGVKLEAETAEPAEASEKAEGSKEIYCYVGPSLVGAPSGTIYNNGLPEVLKKMIENKPVLKCLVVPIGELAAANKALGDSKSALSGFYKIAEKYKKGGAN